MDLLELPTAVLAFAQDVSDVVDQPKVGDVFESVFHGIVLVVVDSVFGARGSAGDRFLAFQIGAPEGIDGPVGRGGDLSRVDLGGLEERGGKVGAAHGARVAVLGLAKVGEDTCGAEGVSALGHDHILIAHFLQTDGAVFVDFFFLFFLFFFLRDHLFDFEGLGAARPSPRPMGRGVVGSRRRLILLWRIREG